MMIEGLRLRRRPARAAASVTNMEQAETLHVGHRRYATCKCTGTSQQGLRRVAKPGQCLFLVTQGTFCARGSRRSASAEMRPHRGEELALIHARHSGVNLYGYMPAKHECCSQTDSQTARCLVITTVCLGLRVWARQRLVRFYALSATTRCPGPRVRCHVWVLYGHKDP